MTEPILILICGFILDTILGDPEKIPHPVVLIGWLIRSGEALVRKIFPATKTGEFIGGALLTLFISAISFFVPLALIIFAEKISVLLRTIIEIICCWQIIAVRTLSKEASAVQYAVESGDLSIARKQIARIVGRDTDHLSLQEIIKACIETVAESSSDGIIAPLFFMTLGGIPLGFLYKAINTLDSMIGYRSERYEYFGKTSARLDDLANFIPARITALLGIIASLLLRYDYKGAWRVWIRDRNKHLSPNSGNPEAVYAGALRLKLGGDAIYFGEIYHKSTLGDSEAIPTSADISRSIKLMYLTSVLGLLLSVITVFVFRTLSN